MNDWFTLYFWIAYAVTFLLALQVPTRMSAKDNFIGTLIMAMFGFLLWPLVVVAYIRTREK